VSNEVFPTLPGLTWNIEREDEWSNSNRMSGSGRSFTRAMWTYPVRHYRLEFEFLRAGAEGELQQLVGFFNRHKADFETWLFDDPLDNTATNQLFANGSGALSSYQLLRDFGGHQSPVFSLNGAPQIYRNSGNWRGTDLFSPMDVHNRFANSQDAVLWSSFQLGGVPQVMSPQIAAPDGTQTGSAIVEGGGNSEHAVDSYTPFTLGPGLYTHSCYMRSIYSGERMGALGMFSAGSNDNYARFNFATGAATVQAGSGSAGMVDAGNGWWRCWLTANVTDTGGPIHRIGIVKPSAPGYRQAYAGDGANGLRVWGMQLQPGVLTRYVPTTGAAVIAPPDYTLSPTGLVTLREALAIGASLRWYGKYYQRCQFKTGRLGYKQFMENLHAAKSVEFKTIKP
jgi:Conserved hypothetical protein 2217 (DUF2460)